MKDELDIQRSKHNLKVRLKNLEEKKEIVVKENLKLINKFVKDFLASGKDEDTVLKYLTLLKKLDNFLKKDFRKATKSDINKIVYQLREMDYVILLKPFYKWLRGTDDYPDEVKKIKKLKSNNHQMLPEEILTQEEVKKLIEVADHPRDKALISLLYESGCRIGEILTIKLKGLTFDKFGAVAIVKGKTGMRRIRIVSSSPYLVEWLNKHPKRDDKEAVLFGTKTSGTLCCYNTIRKLMKILFKKAGIKKKSNPHIFRHSRASYLASHLTEAQMKQYFGWVQSSKMCQIYIHMSGRDVDDALLRNVYGIIEKKEQQDAERDILKPRECPRCKEINAVTNDYCSKCWLPLDPEVVARMSNRELNVRDTELNEALKDDELMTRIAEKIIEIRKRKEGWD